MNFKLEEGIAIIGNYYSDGNIVEGIGYIHLVDGTWFVTLALEGGGYSKQKLCDLRFYDKLNLQGV